MTLSGSSPLSRLVSRPECFGLLFHIFFQIHQIFCLVLRPPPHPAQLVYCKTKYCIELKLFYLYMVLQVYIYFTKIGVQTRMVFHTFSRFPRYFVFIRPLWFEVLYNQRFNRFFCCLYDVRSAYKYVIKSMIDHHHQIHIFMTLMMMMLMRQGASPK